MILKASYARQIVRRSATIGTVALFTGAFLLTSSIFTKAYAQAKTKNDTTITTDSIRKPTIPDMRTLTHYMPYPYGLNDSMFIRRDPDLDAFRAAWMDAEDYTPPFGLPRRVREHYDQEQLKAQWEAAKDKLRVAFLSGKGATPSNAFDVHTPAEVKKLLDEWKDLKRLRNQKITMPIVETDDDTTTIEYIPKSLQPYLKTLEYYVPPPLTLKDFADKSPDVESFRLYWRRADTNYPPFGLPKTAFDSCSAEDQQMVEKKWERANLKLMVSFTKQNGLTPKDALNPAKGGYDPNGREVQNMKRQWQGGKEIDRLYDELLSKPAISVPIQE